MNLDDAIRLTEILLGFVFIQQSGEHLSTAHNERIIFLPRLILSVLLISGIQTPWICIGLLITSLCMLHRFQGPYNGGSDRMGLLILCALTLAHMLPNSRWQEYAFGYLALQVMLSYFIAGWVKFINPEWRKGQALHDVFSFSAYPAAESFRKLARHPGLLRGASWVVIAFEILFPLALCTQTGLVIGLCIAALFHFANACLFGFNRFLWVWLAAYPSLFWLQERVLG